MYVKISELLFPILPTRTCNTAFLNCSLTREVGTWHDLLACLTSFQHSRPTPKKQLPSPRPVLLVRLAQPRRSQARPCYKVISRVILPGSLLLRYVLNVALGLQLQLHFVASQSSSSELWSGIDRFGIYRAGSLVVVMFQIWRFRCIDIILEKVIIIVDSFQSLGIIKTLARKKKSTDIKLFNYRTFSPSINYIIM